MGRLLRIVAVVAALVAFAVGWYAYHEYQVSQRLPAGIVSGNGRIESVQVDVSTKYAGRIVQILAHEGDLVRKGQVLALMDTIELEAQLAEAKAKTAQAKQTTAQIQAEVVQRTAELKYQDQEFARNRELYNRRMLSREDAEQSQTKRDVAVSTLDATRAKLSANLASIEAAQADVVRIQAQITDSTLVSPVVGRVLYRLAEEREVLAAGGKVLTLVNLDDVYMEIFLPSRVAASIPPGAEGRITIDARPELVAPANVTFVSPEAQFTPKQVETQAERDKLMFRIKLKVPEKLLLPYIERVKTGVRGVGYVRLDEETPWPSKLTPRLPDLPKKADEPGKDAPPILTPPLEAPKDGSRPEAKQIKVSIGPGR